LSNIDLAQPAPARPALSRLNLILLALLVVQAVVVVAVFWPRATATGGGALLPELTAEQVTGLTIADNTGQSVALQRGESGWTLAGTDDYPANSEKISTTLSSLIGIKTDRLVTRTAASQKQLEVAEDDFQRRVTLTTAGGDKTIYLGSSAGAGATHVRAGDSDATYLTGDVATWDLDPNPSSWVNAQYVNLSADNVVTLTLTNANGSFVFARGADDAWTLQGAAADEQVASANISTLVSQATAVNLTAPLGKTEKPEYGLAQPQATVVVTSKDDSGQETATTLLVGAKTEEGEGYYFKASSSPYYVTIATYTGEAFVAKQRSDFLTPPAEATDEVPAESAAPAFPTIPDEGAQTSSAVTGTTPLTETSPVTSATPLTAISAVTASAVPTASAELTEAAAATDTAPVTATEVSTPAGE
jgi:hypothetical protein